MLKPVKNFPALLHKQKQEKTLIIADLHLGWEINLTRKGIHVPSQMPKIRRKLLQLISAAKPTTLIILGDVKHTIAKAEPGEWRDIPEFFETINAKVSNIQVIRGNHDGNLKPLLPPTIQLHPSTGIPLNTAGLFHGHTWPSKRLLKCNTLVMGHAHPTVAFRDSLGFRITVPVWVKAECNTEKLISAYLKGKHIKTTKKPTTAIKKHLGIKPRIKQLLIMPCFNDFLGGRPVNKKTKRKTYIGPVLRSEAVEVDKAGVYLLDGTFLGTVEHLRTLN